MNSSIRHPRNVYKPFEYPQANEYFLRQQQAHWLHTEVNMSSDVNDWAQHMTDVERTLVGNVLKGFTQTEVYVGTYWGQRVPCWFPKPEIMSMAMTFAGFEAIHAAAYAHLNTTLGLDDFDAFMHDPAACAKIDAVVDIAPTAADVRSILRSLGLYSGFIEGVSLFSAFAILLSFAQRNLLKGVGQIVSWSVRDESLHSEAGCWLFRTYAQELGAKADLAREEVIEGAKTVVQLEHNFVDMCFSTGPVDGLSAHDVKAMINWRANTKLSDLGIHQRYFEVDREAVERMRWFDIATAGVEHQDFFAARPTAYSKGQTDWAEAF